MNDRDIMQQALDALRQCEFTTPPAQRQIVKNALAALNERLAQPEQEPVWVQPDHLQKARRAPHLCRVEPAQRDDFVPLYTAPPQRKPLTDEQKGSMWMATTIDPCSHKACYLRGIADAEAAHGIKGEA